MTENNNTIAQVVKDGLCTGCGTCIALCPEEAIKLTINEKKGVYVPELNEEKCNNCGICVKVCPGHEVDFKQLNSEIFGKEPEDILIGNYLNCYIGHSTDYNIRYNSSSGGLVTALLIFALEEGIIDGALVTRMKRDNPVEPEPFIARTGEEIIESSKSKYCPVPANIALKEILESKEGEKFAVVGLPCHIQGIRKAEQINKKLKENIVLHFGIVCNHTPTFLATEFLLKKMKIKKEEITKFDYRGEGWPGAMKISLEGGELLLLGEYWGSGFGQCFFPTRCTFCCDHTCELADISFADAWLPEVQEKDNIGTSIIILRNKKSKELLEKAIRKKKITLKKIDSSKVVQSQEEMLDFKKSNLKARISLFNLFGKKHPLYNTSGLSNPTLKAYLSGISLYTRIYLSSKRYLWNLMQIYESSLQKVLSVVRRK